MVPLVSMVPQLLQFKQQALIRLEEETGLINHSRTSTGIPCLIPIPFFIYLVFHGCMPIFSHLPVNPEIFNLRVFANDCDFQSYMCEN